MLQEKFLQLAGHTTNDKSLCLQLWREIEAAYSQSPRHYHNLAHLEQFFLELEACPEVSFTDALAFAVFYHDIIYDVMRQDNEERSAAIAVARLASLQVPAAVSSHCSRLILATRVHQAEQEEGTDHFTDADLAILGKPAAVYQEYCRQIREEYSLYPDDLYQPGRARVLQHFLDMPHVYKTACFRERYEEQARKNMQEELAQLQRG